MFFNKNLRNANKEILQQKNYITDSEGDALISVKATSRDQIFSAYNYDSNEKLNSGLDEYICDKARFIQAHQDVKIKFYTGEDVEAEEVKSAIKNNFKKDYIEARNEIRVNLVFSIIMFVLGVVFLSLLLLMHQYFYNIYLEIIIEIATWVFFWEAVDSFFLERAKIRRKRLIFLKLYTAEVEVVKLKGLEK